MDNVLLRTLYLGVLEHTPQISCQLCNLVSFGHIFRELSLKKIYINLNNINMFLLRTSYSTGSSSNNILNFKLVCLGVYMVKRCHEKMLILRCILPPKN